MVASEGRLGGVPCVVVFDEFCELGMDGLLDDLGWEREQRDGSVVL